MTRRLVAHLLLACCAGVIATAPAQACRVFRAPGDRIASLYAHELFAGAVLVRVTEARHTQAAQPDGDGHPWQARATVERVLSGDRRSGVISFARGFGSAACDDGTPLPRIGDRWVLYLSSDQRGGAVVNLSYPLAVALREDPRLASLRHSAR